MDLASQLTALAGADLVTRAQKRKFHVVGMAGQHLVITTSTNERRRIPLRELEAAARCGLSVQELSASGLNACNDPLVARSRHRSYLTAILIELRRRGR